MNEGIDQSTDTRPLARPQIPPMPRQREQGQPEWPVPVRDRDPQHAPGQRQDRADRQVDPTNHQHQSHAHRNDRQVGDLVYDDPQGLPGPEMVAQQAEEQDQTSQDEQHNQDVDEP